MPSAAETPTLETLTDHCFVRQAIDNVGWVDLGDGAVIIDTLEQRSEADHLFECIQQSIGEKTFRYVINTHTHYDHVALNDTFAQRYDAEIINLDTTDIPAEGKSLAGPDRTLTIYPLPGCHTETDCIIWSPDDRVLFVGDLFGWGILPLTGNPRPEAMERLLDAYDTMTSFDADVVVPGHGPLATIDTLRRFVQYLHELGGQAADAAEQGLSDAQAENQLPPPEDMRDWWRFAEWKHADTRTKLLKAARKGWWPR
jgi:glyoxylase-like metal-dependent hydrolase (beta-lactamase superfamily II)